MKPNELQFNDEGAQNVKDFGHYKVVKVGKGTALQGPSSGMILPTDTPMGGEEIMRRRKIKGQ